MADEKKTPEELAKELQEKRAKAIEDRKKEEIKKGFLNPLGEGTNYKEFLKEVEASKKEVGEYCKGKLTEEEISWLEKDIEIYKTTLKK